MAGYLPALGSENVNCTITPLLNLKTKQWKSLKINYNHNRRERKHSFSECVFDIDNILLLSEIFQRLVYKFASLVFMKETYQIYVMLQVKFTNGEYRSLHPALIISKAELLDYIQFLLDVVDFKGDDYESQSVQQLSFKYFTVDKKEAGKFAERSLEKVAKNLLKKMF